MLNEKEERGNTDGARPSSTRIEAEELVDLRGRKDNPRREVGDMTYASKQIL